MTLSHHPVVQALSVRPILHTLAYFAIGMVAVCSGIVAAVVL